MRSPADRPQTSPLALPPVPHARGSSCPQCGRGPGSHSTIVSWRTAVLYRRPQCRQQLQPSLRLGFVRACSDDIKIEIRRSATTTRSQVPNRPRNRGRSTVWMTKPQPARVEPYILNTAARSQAATPDNPQRSKAQNQSRQCRSLIAQPPRVSRRRLRGPGRSQSGSNWGFLRRRVREQQGRSTINPPRACACWRGRGREALP